MKKFTITLTLILAALFIWKACEKDVPEPSADITSKLLFESFEQDTISYRMAVFSYTIGNMEKNTVDELGICYATHEAPSIEDNTTAAANTNATGTISLQNLEPGTEYYARLYSNLGDATIYGQTSNFQTNPLGSPAVTTHEITDITAITATCGGEITKENGSPVTARGVCYSTSPNPTADDEITTDGTGTGSFTSELTGLNPGTTYYVKAYATNEAGTAYGVQKEFTTDDGLAEITTTEITNITANSATSGGNITDDGGVAITARGVCYSTSPNPTIADNPTSNGTGTGSFTSELTGLTEGTTYYVKAYATNEADTAYGMELSFTTPNEGEVTNPATGETWMDRNLGASRVAQSSTDDQACGDLYQWGRGTDGHEQRNSGTTSTLSSSDNPGHGNFITVGSSPYDWRSPQNDNLWQGVNGTNNPCPAGFRLPTEAEWEAERQSWSSNNAAGAYASPLKLPVAGGRVYSNGSLGNVGSGGYYWSSTVDGTDSRYLHFSSSDAYMGSSSRAYGFSVRCFKD